MTFQTDKPSVVAVVLLKRKSCQGIPAFTVTSAREEEDRVSTQLDIWTCGCSFLCHFCLFFSNVLSFPSLIPHTGSSSTNSSPEYTRKEYGEPHILMQHYLCVCVCVSMTSHTSLVLLSKNQLLTFTLSVFHAVVEEFSRAWKSNPMLTELLTSHFS